MFTVKVGVSQQYNIYTKTAIFFEKVVVSCIGGLAVALATWYNYNCSSQRYISCITLCTLWSGDCYDIKHR